MTIAEESLSKERLNLYGDCEKNLKRFCRQMVKGTLFVGTNTERRYVSQFDKYMNVIKISDDEKEFIKNLKAVKQRCIDFYKGGSWVGITYPETPGAPAGYNLWVDLENFTFGTFWFKVDHVSCKPDKVLIRLEVLRPYETSGSLLDSSNCSTHSNPKKRKSEGSFKDEIKACAKDIDVKNMVWNTVNGVVFFSVFLATLAATAVGLIQYLLDFSLRFMKELREIVKAATPIAISIVESIARVFGYLIMNVTSLFTSNNARQNYYMGPQNRSIQYVRNRQAIGYNKPSSVIITPLD